MSLGSSLFSRKVGINTSKHTVHSKVPSENILTSHHLPKIAAQQYRKSQKQHEYK
jgi:hypothetical protein